MPDFTPIYAKLRESPAHAAGEVLDDRPRVHPRRARRLGDRRGYLSVPAVSPRLPDAPRRAR